MANPNLSDTMKSDSSTGSSGTSSIHDASDRFARDTQSDAKEVIADATEAVSEFYDRASTWVQDNYGKSLTIVAVLAAVGMFGYILGRNMRSSDISEI